MRLFYNGVDIAFGQLVEYKEEPVYDESGIDYLYTRVTVAYVGVVGGLARLKATGPDGRFADLTPTTHPPQPVPAAGPRTGDPYTLYVGGVPSTRSPGRPQPLVPGSGGDGLDARPIDYQTGPYPHPPAIPAASASAVSPVGGTSAEQTTALQGLLPLGNTLMSVGYKLVTDTQVDHSTENVTLGPQAAGSMDAGDPAGTTSHDKGVPVQPIYGLSGGTSSNPPSPPQMGPAAGGVVGAVSVGNNAVTLAGGTMVYSSPDVPGQLPTRSSGTTDPQLGVSYPGGRRRYQIVRSRSARATTTVQAVRSRLETPRGKLVVFSGEGDETDDILLASPEDGCLCDPTGGPHPRVLSLEQVSGDANLFVVQLVIETTINEAVASGVPYPGILLSNRYSMTHVVDEDGWTSLLVHGTARFRLDYVRKYATNPDTARPVLFLPIPPQFQRKNIRVVGLPDGSGVEYEYQDVQQPEVFVAGKYVGASRMEWSHRQAIVSDQNLVGGMLEAYDRYLQIRYSQKWAQEPGAGAGGGASAESPPDTGRRRSRRRRRS